MIVWAGGSTCKPLNGDSLAAAIDTLAGLEGARFISVGHGCQVIFMARHASMVSLFSIRLLCAAAVLLWLVEEVSVSPAKRILTPTQTTRSSFVKCPALLATNLASFFPLLNTRKRRKT